MWGECDHTNRDGNAAIFDTSVNKEIQLFGGNIMKLPNLSQSIQRSRLTSTVYQSSQMLPSQLSITNEFEEENVRRTIVGYVRNIVSQGCFPCCFCCNQGNCCAECREKNLAANL